jgi:hypothetical protein
VLESLFLDALQNSVGDYPLHRLGLDCEAPTLDADQQVDALDALGRLLP